MELFFDAITTQARSRATRDIPDVEDYINVRRDTSACKPCWVLIEYAGGLDLPDEVMEHPIIQNLEEAANEFISWSNVRTFAILLNTGDPHFERSLGHLFIQL